MTTPKTLLLASTALAVLGASTAVFAPSASAQVPPPPAANGPRRGGERHPELRRALRSLERTEYDLRHAAHDFGGHRQKAADLCRQAQQEI